MKPSPPDNSHRSDPPKETRKAIFLDRDGVINDNSAGHYIWKPEDLVINPGVPQALRAFREMGYLLIIISNQGGVARGEYSREDVEEFHRHLQEELGRSGATVDEMYYCPHHDEAEACLCRKPRALMIEKALARFGIDPSRSWFIGDSQRDMEAGKAAGLRTLLVPSNDNLISVMEKFN
jgi:D-glycero-D-manno-heptose 1,7-bisphosphate phosphatase